MNNLRLLFLCGFLSFFSLQIFSMEEEVENLTSQLSEIQLDDGFDSDSEDEADYVYSGYGTLRFSSSSQSSSSTSSSMSSNDYILFYRGIHFSPSKFTKKQRSEMRKNVNTGNSIYSAAAYELSEETLGDVFSGDTLDKQAYIVRKAICDLKEFQRNSFQKLSTNQYDYFLKTLGEKHGFRGSFTRNPQVNTSESFFHAGKYAFGQKYLGKKTDILDPEYAENGKPKHPYIGKIYIVLINVDQIKEIDPYFVVHAHANDKIKVSTHRRKNILTEREVAFPGFIEGRYVIYEKPIRVPSFKGDYKLYYKEKYGMTQRSFKNRQTRMLHGKTITVKSLITSIIEHVAQSLEDYIKAECAKKNIKIICKQYDGSFSGKLQTLDTAVEYREFVIDKEQREFEDLFNNLNL